MTLRLCKMSRTSQTPKQDELSWSLEPFSLSHPKNQPNGRSISDTTDMFMLERIDVCPG